MLVGCGFTKAFVSESSKSTLSPATTLPLVYCWKTVIALLTRFDQLAVVRSQLVPLTPFHATWLGTEVMLRSIEVLPVLLTSVAATPGGGETTEVARPDTGVPVYLMRVNVPTFRPVAAMLMTMFVPGAEMLPATLIAAAVGFAVTVP